MNTRKYPRSILEAFGTDARSACAIERPQERAYGLAWWVCMAVVGVVAVVLVGGTA